MTIVSPKWRQNPFFLDTPREFEQRVDRMVGHLRHAEWIFYNTTSKGIPNPRDLIWLLLRDAMHTTHNTPFAELKKIASFKTVMPPTRITIQQAWDIRLARLQAGMSEYDDPKVRHVVNESDQDRMVDVLDLMRFVQGRNARLMVKVLLARAAGLSVEQCGRIWDKHRTDFDRRAFHDIKQRCIGQILVGLDQQFGLVKTARGFRRLTLLQIEDRAKRRRRQQEEALAD